MSTRYPGFDGLEFTAGELAQAAKPSGQDSTMGLNWPDFLIGYAFGVTSLAILLIFIVWVR